MVALAGWAVGMLPSTLTDGSASPPMADPPVLLLGLGAAAGGAAAGLAFGWAQWTVLRHHVSPSRRWIGANALGWALAIAWIYIAASLPTETTPGVLVALAGVGGGLLSGLTLGAVTGWALLQFVEIAPPLSPQPDGAST